MLNSSGNNLTFLPANSFSGLVALRFLDLSENELKNVKLTRLSNLKELDLSNNQIKVLSSDQMRGFPGLRKLFLNHTHLESIEPGTFSHFRNSPLVLLDAEEPNYELLKPFEAEKLVDIILKYDELWDV
jgi:hypothetical protein